jgi:hypothetical protein
MKATMTRLALAIALGICAMPAHGALLISEVLFNEVSSDTTGEWIEIYNSGPAAVDLSNYKIGDEETSGGTGATEAMFQFPAGATIPAGAVQIIAAGAIRFQTVYGFLPTYETSSTDLTVPDLTVYSAWDPDGGNVNMSNTNDQAVILDAGDAVVDAVNWGNTTYLNPGLAQPVADGTSYERINPNVDTNTAADWKLGSPSSPGVVVPEPTTFAVGVVGAAMLFARRRR